MFRSKKIFIILLTFILIFGFCGSAFAGDYSNGQFDRFLGEHTQYREVNGEKVPAFAMPWKVQKWAEQLPEYEQIQNKELGLLIIHSVEKGTHSWLFWVLPKDTKVFIEPYNGQDYIKISTRYCGNVYRAGSVSSSAGSNYLGLDNFTDAPKKIGNHWEMLDTTYSYKMINGQRCYFGYTSVPFYSDAQQKNLFFQGSHLEREEVKLVSPMQVAEIPEMITKVATILTKVGLIMLSLFLLVYLVRYKMFL